ncbi:hypothetical protein [Streptomyces sp. NPDC049040]|uniref:VMAP-C domain-containing protein n=1 Tax=Streptomyces sp. NPDC049040 TaxID=3365593 RepID=UPI0037211A2F
MTPGAAAGSHGFDTAPRNWDAAEADQLCTVLGGFFDFQDPQFFQQVVFAVGKRLGPGYGRPFAVAFHHDVRSQIVALVQTIERHRDPEGVLRALADTLRFLRGDQAAMAELDELVEELAPAGRLLGPRLRAVVATLDAMKKAVPLAAASDALARAALPGEPSALRGNETVTDMVRRLNDAREAVPAGGATGGEVGHEQGPLVLRFLAELARVLPEDAAAVLRGHIALAAEELLLPPHVAAALAARRGLPHGPAARRVLQIRLNETAPGKQEYEMDGTLFDWTDSGLQRPRKRAGKRPYGIRELKELGRTCLIEWEDLAAQLDEADRVQVEFLLPWSLLGHPVDRWLTDTQGYLLGHKYPVVIRSLDRLRQRSWHRDWELRWKALQRTATPGHARPIGWLATDSATVLDQSCEVLYLSGREGEIRAWLDAHPDAAGVALAFAYDHHDPRHALSVQEAVCEGVPFMVWRRDDGNPAELALRLRESEDKHYTDLPAHLRLWRRGAARDDLSDMHNHLTLLWDDPDCVYRETALSVPGAYADQP